MEAHINDVGPGINWDYVFFDVSKENHTGLKVERCEFMKETVQYLGFDIGYGWWTCAASKAKPLMAASDGFGQQQSSECANAR